MGYWMALWDPLAPGNTDARVLGPGQAVRTGHGGCSQGEPGPELPLHGGRNRGEPCPAYPQAALSSGAGPRLCQPVVNQGITGGILEAEQ